MKTDQHHIHTSLVLNLQTIHTRLVMVWNNCDVILHDTHCPVLIVPRTRTKTILVASSHASPAIWNSLPDDLRDPELSIGCFRNKLKTFLFSQIWCLLELVVLYSHLVFCLIMSIVCRARQRDILLAGAFEMSWLIDWLIGAFHTRTHELINLSK